MFTTFDKAIAAVVGALLAVASLVFKSDLGSFGIPVTGVITALIPVLVYLIPNASAAIQDGGSLAGVEGVVGEVADTITKAIPAPAAPVVVATK